MDSMESIMKGCDRVMETSHVKWVLNQYTLLFSRMAHSWKRVVCLSSLDAAFWDIVERGRYDWARDWLAAMARSVGITVVDSTPMWRETRP